MLSLRRLGLYAAFGQWCRRLTRAAILFVWRKKTKSSAMPDKDSFNLPELPNELHPDAVMYANRMAEIRTRLGRISSAVDRIKRERKQDDSDIEMIFVQFRKCCELIALGSLIANKKAYSEQYADFASDWRLSRIVDKLRKVNPDFFPVPMSEPVKGAGRANFTLAKEGFLTEAEMIRLYNIAGKLLHSRNPFSTEDPTHDIGFSVDGWVTRLNRLLRWHYIQQTESSRWLVQVPETGNVHVYPTIPSG